MRMQHLLFRIGRETFAVPLLEIEVVLPVPELEPLAQSPDHVAGLLRYRGRLIPVVDVGLLRGLRPASQHISSRLILVQRAGQGAAQIALLVERALEVMDLQPAGTLPTIVAGEGAHWLSEDVLTGSGDLVRAVDWGALLTPELLELAGRKQP